MSTEDKDKRDILHTGLREEFRSHYDPEEEHVFLVDLVIRTAIRVTPGKDVPFDKLPEYTDQLRMEVIKAYRSAVPDSKGDMLVTSNLYPAVNFKFQPLVDEFPEEKISEEYDIDDVIQSSTATKH